MQVTVHLRPAATHRLTAPPENVCSVVSNLGLALKPIHPGANDPDLQPHYYVDVPDEETARQLCERLLATNGVDAAYLKPPDSPP